ncbi:MAG: ABC transporter permease [Anaerolineae bacterium]
MNTRSRAMRAAVALAPIALTLLFTTTILLLAGANPFEAYAHIVGGALESPRKIADVIVALVPLLLASAGMLVTFSAGLWNIGVEGQMIAGALMTTWLVRSVSAPAAIVLPLTVLAGMLGGVLWGLLIGALRTYGRVHEIFAGLGLNFVAVALTNYLIFGPWRPAGGATMSGTDPFPESAWMPTVGTLRAGLLPLALAVCAIVIVYILLRHTYWGLKLKAVGANRLAAERMGMDTSLNMLAAFAVCGLFAGLGGSLQTTAVYHRLIPSITGGYGYLSQLVVLLSGLKALWVPLVVLFFSIIQVGSPRLELRMMLDSSLGGVLQSSVVLFFLLTRGLRQRLEAKKELI